MKEIPVKIKDGSVIALVDDADFARLSAYSWWVSGSGYAKRTGVWMHRDVLSTPLQVDHINGNKLDNRRENLREATRSQNQAHRGAQKNSKSGVKGVSQRGSKWRAFIQVKGRTLWLGSFGTKEEAADAYRVAALRHYGEFAGV